MSVAEVIAPRLSATKYREPASRHLGTGRQKIPALTGLRFIAALWVVLYHVHILLGLDLGSLIGTGYAGVGLFFVLSGFILTYTYVAESGHLQGTRRAFYSARFARIYPVYLCGLLIGLPFLSAMPTFPGAGPLVIIATLAGMQAWFPPIAGIWDGPSWSVSVEALFYVLFPFLVPIIVRIPVRRLPLALLLCWLLAFALPVSFIVVSPDRLRAWGWSYNTIVLALRFIPLPRLPEFFLGMVAGQIFLRHQRRVRTGYLAIGVVVAVTGILATTSFDLPYLFLHDGSLDLWFVLLIGGLAAQRGRIARLLSHPISIRMGEASYALYLLHIPLLYAMIRLIAPISIQHQYVYVIPYLAVCIAASLATYRWLEVPARRYLRRRLTPP